MDRTRAAGVKRIGRGFDAPAARGSVALLSTMDIALGIAVCYRPWCRLASLATVAASAAYLIGASVLAPELWADPLGPLVKILPAAALGLVVGLGWSDR